MYDPVRHVVVDTNLLAAFLHPGSTHNPRVRDRAKILLEAAMTAKWPGVRLYAPAICIAESLAVLDKYRFCDWHGPVKQDKTKQLSVAEYESARRLLTRAVKERVIEEVEHEPHHVLLAGLVSPANYRYQIRRKLRASAKKKGHQSKIKPPMGAADCLIAGLTIHLAQRLGKESVLLATGDQRLSDVVGKLATLRLGKAEELGLTAAALDAGVTWSTDLYPNVVNLQRATEAQMRTAFGGWPLPTSPLTTITRTGLTPGLKERLTAAWLEVATERDISNPDSIAYGPILEDIRTRFAVATCTYLSSKDVFLFLLRERKASRLPKPGAAKASSVPKPGGTKETDDATKRLPLFPDDAGGAT